MHGAFDAASKVNESTNEGAAAMRATVFYGVDRTFNVEESNLDAVDSDELATARRQVV